MMVIGDEWKADRSNWSRCRHVARGVIALFSSVFGGEGGYWVVRRSGELVGYVKRG